MADMCALVYTLWVRSVEARWAVLHQAAAAAMAAGAQGVELPNLDEALTELDDYLFAEPANVDPDEAVLMRALGVAEG